MLPYKSMRALLFILLSAILPACTGSETLQDAVSRAAAGHDATVGVSVRVENGPSVAVNDSIRYPVMSVFKFHVATAALNTLKLTDTPLNTEVILTRQQLPPATYSPLRDAHPDGEVRTSYRELIEYAVALSDNNACDVLIDFAGGIDSVASFVRSIGIDGFDLTQTERSMHESPERCYDNWSHPSSMTALLEKIYATDVLSPERRDFLRTVMESTTTGPDKLRAGVPQHLTLGHKTGHSDRRPDGVKPGDCDAGVVTLPDGRRLYIAVFIRDSRESDAANAAIIADIAAAACNFILRADD